MVQDFAWGKTRRKGYGWQKRRYERTPWILMLGALRSNKDPMQVYNGTVAWLNGILRKLVWHRHAQWNEEAADYGYNSRRRWWPLKQECCQAGIEKIKNLSEFPNVWWHNSGKIGHRTIQGEESKWLKDFKYYPGKVECWGHCQKCGK